MLYSSTLLPILCQNYLCMLVSPIRLKASWEWIPFSLSFWCSWCLHRAFSTVFTHAQLLSRVWFFVIPRIVAPQAPLSMDFSRQGYWSGLPFPFPGGLPDPGIKPRFPALEADSLLSEPPETPVSIFFNCIDEDFRLIDPWKNHLSIFYYNAIWEYQWNIVGLSPNGSNYKHSESIPFAMSKPSELYRTLKEKKKNPYS